MGVKFFDFAFDKNGVFTKHYIMSKLDRKVIVTALKNDLELVLLRQDLSRAKMLGDTGNNYIAIPAAKGNNYYITTPGCTKLLRIEKASKRKAVVDVSMMDYNNGIPDSINIAHKNFKFTIALKKTER